MTVSDEVGLLSRGSRFAVDFSASWRIAMTRNFWINSFGHFWYTFDMTQTEMIQNVILAAKRDVDAAGKMLESKHNTWCLFMWHLVIEKMLKAVLMMQDKNIIYTHNLIVLYQKSGLDLGTSVSDHLAEINRFNIEARYDFEKEEFYKKATDEYTAKWSQICEAIYKNLYTYVNQKTQ